MLLCKVALHFAAYSPISDLLYYGLTFLMFYQKSNLDNGRIEAETQYLTIQSAVGLAESDATFRGLNKIK